MWLHSQLAMTDGTGLSQFAERYPERFIDVGIAEEHVVLTASAMASHGLKPVVAVYSTFFGNAPMINSYMT